MIRLAAALCLTLGLATVATTARLEELRVPPQGPHAFAVTVLKGWHGHADAAGGLLLTPPPASQHVMIYLAVVTDAAAARMLASPAGVDKIEAIEGGQPALLGGRNAIAFTGRLASKRPRFARRVRIVLVRLAPDTVAQQWGGDAAGHQRGRDRGARSRARRHPARRRQLASNTMTRTLPACCSNRPNAIFTWR
jgi:hypothetical protein